MDYDEGKYGTFRLIPYLYEGIMYSLPTNASLELKRHIQAAIISYKEGDHEFLKTRELLEEIDIENDIETKDRAIDTIIQILQSLNDVLKVIQSINTAGSIYYSFAMGRLVSTFESCVILLRHGYYIETSPLFRLILEQLAWAYSIINKNADEITKKGQILKAIAVIEELKQGTRKLYGMYSEEAHLDIEGIQEYLHVDTGNGMVGYSKRSGIKSKERSSDLLFLSELYILSVKKTVEKLNLTDYEMRPNVSTGESLMATIQLFNMNYEYYKTGNITDPITGIKGKFEFIDDI